MIRLERSAGALYVKPAEAMMMSDMYIVENYSRDKMRIVKYLYEVAGRRKRGINTAPT